MRHVDFRLLSIFEEDLAVPVERLGVHVEGIGETVFHGNGPFVPNSVGVSGARGMLEVIGDFGEVLVDVELKQVMMIFAHGRGVLALETLALIGNHFVKSLGKVARLTGVASEHVGRTRFDE